MIGPLVQGSQTRLPLCPALLLAAIGLNSAVSLAEDILKTPGEIWTAPVRASHKPNPVPTDPKSVSQGKDLFIAACVPCHGPAGKGDGPVSTTLERDGAHIRPGNLSDPKLWQQSDGAIFWKISEGRNPMPSFQEALSEEQRWQIVNYVRTLAAKQENKNTGNKNEGKQ